MILDKSRYKLESFMNVNFSFMQYRWLVLDIILQIQHKASRLCFAIACLCVTKCEASVFISLCAALLYVPWVTSIFISLYIFSSLGYKANSQKQKHGGAPKQHLHCTGVMFPWKLAHGFTHSHFVCATLPISCSLPSSLLFLFLFIHPL